MQDTIQAGNILIKDGTPLPDACESKANSVCRAGNLLLILTDSPSIAKYKEPDGRHRAEDSP
jgi:hypothetical protein